MPNCFCIFQCVKFSSFMLIGTYIRMFTMSVSVQNLQMHSSLPIQLILNAVLCTLIHLAQRQKPSILFFQLLRPKINLLLIDFCEKHKMSNASKTSFDVLGKNKIERMRKKSREPINCCNHELNEINLMIAEHQVDACGCVCV